MSGGVAGAPGLSLDEYQRGAARTMAPFGSTDGLSLAVWALGVAEAAGALVEYVKKHVGHGHALDVGTLTSLREDVVDAVRAPAPPEGHFKAAVPHNKGRAVWALGLVGEAGEVAALVRHQCAGGGFLDRVRQAKELGDVLWYVAAAAEHEHMDLGQIAAINLAKLRARFPAAFSSEASLARVDMRMRPSDGVTPPGAMPGEESEPEGGADEDAGVRAWP